MSVFANARGESGIEYCDLAWKIYDHTMTSCTRFPKRWDRYILLDIVKEAKKVQEYCVGANSIYPTNQHEAQLRRDFLILANCALQDLNTLLGHLARKIDAARKLDQENPKAARELPMKLTEEKTEAMLQKWGELIAEEAKKISAVKKSNAEQFKNLPPGPAGMPPTNVTK